MVPQGASQSPDERDGTDPQPHVWAALMTAKTAAKYTDEPSPKAFLRRVGKVYPKPIRVPGRRGGVWRRKDLDDCIAALRGPTDAFSDLADVL